MITSDGIIRLEEVLINYPDFICVRGTGDCLYAMKHPDNPNKVFPDNKVIPCMEILYKEDGFYKATCGILRRSSFGFIYSNEPEYINPPVIEFSLDCLDSNFIPRLKQLLFCPVLKKAWQNKRGT